MQELWDSLYLFLLAPYPGCVWRGTFKDSHSIYFQPNKPGTLRECAAKGAKRGVAWSYTSQGNCQYYPRNISIDADTITDQDSGSVSGMSNCFPDKNQMIDSCVGLDGTSKAWIPLGINDNGNTIETEKDKLDRRTVWCIGMQSSLVRKCGSQPKLCLIHLIQ